MELVKLYADPNYTGLSQTFGVTTLKDVDISRKASSIQVAAFTRVVLYTKDDYGNLGKSLMLDGPINIPDLTNRGFDDNIQSIAVIHNAPPIETRVACCSSNASNAGSCGVYSGNSAECVATMKLFCNAYPERQECKEWCKNNSEFCDASVMQYCEKNPNDPYCSCINSPANKLGLANPKCVDAKCIRGGYLTTNMIKTPCPTIINCEVRNTLVNQGVALATSFSTSQNCSDKPQSELDGGGAPDNTMMIILFVVVVMIAVFLKFSTVSMQKSETYASVSASNV